MAESGAHLSSAVNSDDRNRPSIFEVLAQESLLSTLRPALVHILRIASERNPERYGRLYTYCNELYAALQLILEGYYLKQYNATFSENFYGLCRIPLTANIASTSNLTAGRLNLSQRLRSLLVLILVPYIKNKLDALYERLHESSLSGDGQYPGLRGRLHRLFLFVYPLIHTTFEGSVLYYQLCYIIGVTSCHSPLLRLAGLRIRHLTEDEQGISKTSPPLSALLANKSRSRQFVILLGKALSFASLALSSSLSVGVFFLQFLDWWYASDRRAVDVMALPDPGPPPKFTVENRHQLPNVCPLCNKLRRNETVLSVSGFVFCYPCIHKYIEEKGCCPISGYPVRQDNLVRLYQANAI